MNKHIDYICTIIDDSLHNNELSKEERDHMLKPYFFQALGMLAEEQTMDVEPVESPQPEAWHGYTDEYIGYITRGGTIL